MSETERPLIEWEELADDRKIALKLLSEHDLLTFTRIWYQIMQSDRLLVNWHHRHLCAELEKVFNRETNNLIINIPPGGTKTELCSIHLPAYSAIKFDRTRFLNISYSDSLVKRNSKRTRDIIKSEEFQALWPCEMGSDQAEEWSIKEKRKIKCEVVSRSAGGQITGGRGGFYGDSYSGAVMLDDFNKPEDLFSKVKREKYNRILVDTVRSRRADKTKAHPTPIISIQQRLHVLDATGFMLDGGMGMKFTTCKIPALINEEYIQSLPEKIRDYCWKDIKGTEQINGYWSYWPMMEDVGDLMALWESNEYTFMSQYMQAPISLGGQLFNPEWWKFYGGDNETFQDMDCDFPEPNAYEFRFITGDTAQKTKEQHDYSVFCCWGIFCGRLYLIDMLRGKWEAPDLRRTLKQFISKHWDLNSHRWGNLQSVNIEDKTSGTGLIQEVSRGAPLPITAVQRDIDKVTRANDTTPQIKLGKVVLPMGAPYILDFVSEHSLFTVDDSHDHDDMVDNTCDGVEIGILHTKAPIVAAFRRGR